MNAREIKVPRLCFVSGRHIGDAANEPPTTGWPAGMLQDDSRELSQWLANRIDSKRHADEAVAAIHAAKLRNFASPYLRPYVVHVKDGPQVRLSFDVLASSKVAAQMQHECLCEPGEQVVVYTPEEWEAKRFQPKSLTAMELQLKANDVANVVGGGW